MTDSRIIYPLFYTKVTGSPITLSGTHPHADWKVTIADFAPGRRLRFDNQMYSGFEGMNDPSVQEAFSFFSADERNDWIRDAVQSDSLFSAIAWLDISFRELPPNPNPNPDDLSSRMYEAHSLYGFADEISTAFLSAGRLIFSGDLWVSEVYIRHTRPPDYEMELKEPANPTINSFGGGTLIDSSSQAELQALMQRIINIKYQPASQYMNIVNLILSFFESSFYHVNWAHRFLDLAITVEGAFKKDESESRNVFGKRLARLIGHTKAEVQSIRQAIDLNHDCFFVIRNELAHGKMALDDRAVTDAIRVCRPYIKRAIQSVVISQAQLEGSQDYYDMLEAHVNARFNGLPST